MKFLSTLETKAVQGDPTGPPRWLGSAQRTSTPGQAPWLGWSTLRATTDAYEREPYVFRSIHALAVAISRLPVVLRKDDPWNGEILDTTEDPLLQVLNRRANGMEFGTAFKYRLVTQLMLSKRGIFVERIKSNGGKLLGLHLLDPDCTHPITPTMEELRADPSLMVSRYDVKLPGLPTFEVPAEDVCWIRWPHPINVYSGVTPIESLGLSIDTAFYARLHNRTFLANDGRPGGVLALKGRLSPDETAELQSRFGGKQPAGRTTVLSVDDATYLDTAATPREMAYSELRNAMKEEVLTGVGTPESVAGNASGRTFDNADAEAENWYTYDVMPNAELIGQALSIWTAGGDDDDNVVGFDTSKINVLQRFERLRENQLSTLFQAGLISRGEFRKETGRKPLTDEEALDTTLGPTDKPPPEQPPPALPAPQYVQNELDAPAARTPGETLLQELAGAKSLGPPPFATGRSVRAVLRPRRRHLNA